MIEVGDPRRLAHHLEHVEIAVGVERIPGVVRRKADWHTARLQFVHERHAPPARRTRSVTILQVHVAHGQAHDVHPRLGGHINGFKRAILRLR